MHNDGYRRQGERCPRAGRGVRTLARNFFCRVVRRALKNRSRQRINGLVDIFCRRRSGDASDFAGRVIGRRFGAEADRRIVDLGLVIDIPREARSAAHEKDEQSGREGIERASVTDTACPQ